MVVVNVVIFVEILVVVIFFTRRQLLGGFRSRCSKRRDEEKAEGNEKDKDVHGDVA